jgi:uncharacterized membrane protein
VAVALLDALAGAALALVAAIVVTGGGGVRLSGATLDLGRVEVPLLVGLAALAARRRLGPPAGSDGPAVLRALRAAGDALARRPAAVYGVIGLGTALLAAVAVRRHRAFHTAGFDLGIFDQALWNTAHGRLLFSSIKGEISLLADHLDPLQLLLVPLYRVAPSPLIPLVAQALALGLGAVPLYWLARRRFPGSILAAAFPLAYLLYLPLRSANRFDFHPTAFAPVLLLLALYWMDEARWGRMLGCLVLAGLAKENLPAAGMAVGLYLALVRGRVRLGAALLAGFGAWLAAGLFWVIPAFNPAGYPYWSRYGTGGGTLALLDARKLAYLVRLYGPVAFLPWLAPSTLLLAAPFLAQNLLATAEAQVSIDYHYALELVPFVFYGAVAGAAALRGRLAGGEAPGRWDHRLAGLLLAASLLFHGRPEMLHLRQYRPTDHHARLVAALARIPPDAPVSAQNRLVPHLAHREFVYVFPDLGPGTLVRARYVVLDRALDRWPLPERFDAEVAALPARGFRPILDQDGILVFERP